jgi:NADH-quinone oxidoreductase E subunit
MSLPVRPETDRAIDALKASFPHPGSALLPALHLVQEETGCIAEEAMVYVAGKIGVSPAFVAGVVSFYTMFHTRPVGRHHIQVCRTLPCALRGAGEIVAHLSKRLGIQPGETTPDGRFSLVEVECLGTCDTAPICQINDEEHGRLDPQSVDRLLESLR